MTRTIKFKGERGHLITEIVIKHTEQVAYSPDFKKKVEEMKNKVYDFLREQGYNYSEIKEPSK